MTRMACIGSRRTRVLAVVTAVCLAAASPAKRVADLESIDDVALGSEIPSSVVLVGGWKDPYFWVPKVTAGSGTSRSTVTETTGNGAGDTTYSHAYNTGNEAYVLQAVVEPSRLKDAEGVVSVDGTWSLVSDTSGACTLSGNILSGGGQDAVCVVRFTDTTGKSKTVTVSVGKWSKQELVIQNPYGELAGTFRKAYSDQILEKFAPLDWSTGHVFPNFMRFNRDRNYPCYFGKEPWELELYSDYDTWATTSSKTWGGSTNFTFFTEGVADSPATKAAGLTYKNALVSYANGPKEMNADFFWPALQDKLRCVSGARADWYAEKQSIKLSEHYLLAATHYNQARHRFFDSTGAKHDYTADASVVPTDEDGKIGFDWTIMVVTNGISDVPNVEFIGDHAESVLVLSGTDGDTAFTVTFDRSLAALCADPAGTYSFTINYGGVDYVATGNKLGIASGTSYTDLVQWQTSLDRFNGAGMEFGTYGIDAIFSLSDGGAVTPPTLTWEDVSSGGGGTSSIYNLSPSLLNGAPAIQVTQSDTVALGYLRTSAYGGDDLAGISTPTNRVSYSLRLTLPIGWNWINTSYPAMNAVHPYYNKKCIQLKDGTTFKDYTVTVADIEGFYDQTPNDDFILYKGEHYPIAGDSSRPLLGFFNGHLWLYGIFYSPSGGQSALDLATVKRLDAWIRQDSLARFGTEEGLTFIDCCDLDPNGTYHSH